MDNKPGHDLDKKARTGDVLINENVDFDSLLLSSTVLRGLKESGFERPSPIQLKAIPLGRCGLDLIVQAKSGTGKTCVFAVVALENIVLESSGTQVLVLAPTREIAVQIWEVINSIGCCLSKLRCYTFIGGMPLADDIQKLKRCHIAVGTPGRVKQLIENQLLSTDSVRLFVLDEADKLLEKGFQETINWIYSALPDNKQMLALSATYPEVLAQSLTAYMRNPTFVRLNVTDPALLGIRQYYKSVTFHPLPQKAFERKAKCLMQLLSAVSFSQCLVFSNYQLSAQSLSELLNSKGWPSTYISGSQDQQHRLTAMAKLKKFKCRVLISTDLTSRGIDAENVNLVVNMDIPNDHETYLHRIGRAGRFGTYGAAVTLACLGKETLSLQAIEHKCGTNILPLPDPIPLDLARSSGFVNLADCVTTEQLITQGDSAKHTNLTSQVTGTQDDTCLAPQGTGSQDVTGLTSKVTGSQDGTGLTSQVTGTQDGTGLTSQVTASQDGTGLTSKVTGTQDVTGLTSQLAGTQDGTDLAPQVTGSKDIADLAPEGTDLQHIASVSLTAASPLSDSRVATCDDPIGPGRSHGNVTDAVDSAVDRSGFGLSGGSLRDSLSGETASDPASAAEVTSTGVGMGVAPVGGSGDGKGVATMGMVEDGRDVARAAEAGRGGATKAEAEEGIGVTTVTAACEGNDATTGADDGGCVAHEAGDGGCVAHEAGDGGCVAHEAGDGGCIAHEAGDGGCVAHGAGDGGCVAHEAGDGGCVAHRAGDGGCIAHEAGDGGCVAHGAGDGGCVAHEAGDGGCVAHRAGDGGCVAHGAGDGGCAAHGAGDGAGMEVASMDGAGEDRGLATMAATEREVSITCINGQPATSSSDNAIRDGGAEHELKTSARTPQKQSSIDRVIEDVKKSYEQAELLLDSMLQDEEDPAGVFAQPQLKSKPGHPQVPPGEPIGAPGPILGGVHPVGDEGIGPRLTELDDVPVSPGQKVTRNDVDPEENHSRNKLDLRASVGHEDPVLGIGKKDKSLLADQPMAEKPADMTLVSYQDIVRERTCGSSKPWPNFNEIVENYKQHVANCGSELVHVSARTDTIESEDKILGGAFKLKCDDSLAKVCQYLKYLSLKRSEAVQTPELADVKQDDLKAGVVSMVGDPSRDGENVPTSASQCEIEEVPVTAVKTVKEMESERGTKGRQKGSGTVKNQVSNKPYRHHMAVIGGALCSGLQAEPQSRVADRKDVERELSSPVKRRQQHGKAEEDLALGSEYIQRLGAQGEDMSLGISYAEKLRAVVEDSCSESSWESSSETSSSKDDTEAEDEEEDSSYESERYSHKHPEVEPSWYTDGSDNHRCHGDSSYRREGRVCERRFNDLMPQESYTNDWYGRGLPSARHYPQYPEGFAEIGGDRNNLFPQTGPYYDPAQCVTDQYFDYSCDAGAYSGAQASEGSPGSLQQVWAQYACIQHAVARGAAEQYAQHCQQLSAVHQQYAEYYMLQRAAHDHRLSDIYTQQDAYIRQMAKAYASM